MGETTRQKRIQKQLQQDLAEIFQLETRTSFKGVIVSVTKVKITSDLADSKVYLSIFPTKEKDVFMDFLNEEASRIKNLLAQRVRHQLRRIPNIQYIFDDSLDYINRIDDALKGKGIDPIKDSKG